MSDIGGLKIRPYADESAAVPEPRERAVPRGVRIYFHHQVRLDRHIGHRRAICQVSGPSGRQWAGPRMATAFSAKRHRSHPSEFTAPLCWQAVRLPDEPQNASIVEPREQQ